MFRTKCNLCLDCVAVCPTGALAATGRCMTLEDVMKEVESDKLFYQNSGGGATLSGGEPLMQPEFALDLLKACKSNNIHTAIDTSGYVPWDDIERVLSYCDLMLYDVKHMDPLLHRQFTGKSNKLILENGRKLKSRVRTWVRVPLVPGFNDSQESLIQVAHYALEIGAEKVSLLPYHEWGKGKYERLGKRYSMDGTKNLSDETVDRCRETVAKTGISATVGQ